MIDFQALPSSAPAPGLVLRIGDSDPRFLRVTHVFADYLYYMWVSEPENAYYARRPQRMLITEFQRMADASSSAWGRIPLPSNLSDQPTLQTKKQDALEAAWHLIEPLVEQLRKERNLLRWNFTALIRQRADITDTRFITLHRLILRYYYFGGTRLALLPLSPGSRPGTNPYVTLQKSTDEPIPSLKRRGRQSILAAEFGPNTFIVSPADLADMHNSLTSCLRKGPTFLTHAYEYYLSTFFSKRHRLLYKEYLEGRCVVPVSVKQYRYYIRGAAQLSDELARNLRTKDTNVGYVGALRATGPGEVYEIDSTGGRFHLVSSGTPPIHLGTPTIYLIIDRWSRFIVSVYVTLRPPSYEEVRHALLIAFTSREARFRALDIDIDDERWPIGRVPSELCPDRGSDFMSASMEQSVVQDLRINLTPLPPYCPDGKATVERMIREIKRRMAASGKKGVYADRPLDPLSKKAARKAADVAVHSLADAYRMLIEIIIDHNNRPHTALRRRRALSQAGVAPTPRAAYLWGLEHLTGLRPAPFVEEDYHRLLLSIDNASIANKVLKFKTRSYYPANEAAFRLTAKSTARPKQFTIRVDRTGPFKVFVPTTGGSWAEFHINAGGASELHGLTLDEEEALSSNTAVLFARSDHEARIERLNSKVSTVVRGRKRGKAVISVSRSEQLEVRGVETNHLKRQLGENRTKPIVTTSQPFSSSLKDEARIYEEQRLQALEYARKHRQSRQRDYS